MSDERSKIFLSYVHADIAMAKKIYNDLKRYNLDIWFDDINLLPGQTWEVEIQNAIESSVYFLALFSSTSVDHIGFAQKELKLALEKLDLYPEGRIYIIPARINECKIANSKIKKIHWINLFPESEYQNGLRKILKIVKADANLLRSEPRKLSDTGINEMLLRYDFYDRNRNPEGKGLKHQYKLQKITGDEIIFDESTGLIWQQSGSPDWINFEDAEKYIKKINRNKFAGFNDWRLPTLEEAISLKEPQEYQYINPIFDSKQRWIWTSDTDLGAAGRQWIVYFGNGSCFINSSLDFYGFVRAVRSGQSSQ